MISFGHTAVGAAIGLGVYSILGDSNPPLTLVAAGSAAFASHYLADFIPHGHFFRTNELAVYNSKIGPVLIFDLVLSLLIFIFVSFYKFNLDLQFWSVLFGIGGSQLPDVLDGLMFTKRIPKVGILKHEYKFHENVHWHGKAENALLIGVRDLWQAAVVVIALYLILSF